MIRLSELKLPLSALPVLTPRAADAPAETDADRHLPPHPDAVLHELAAQALNIAKADIDTLTVFKRSFDARKQNLLVVYIVDISLHNAAQETQLLQQHADSARVCLAPDPHPQGQVRAVEAGDGLAWVDGQLPRPSGFENDQIHPGGKQARGAMALSWKTGGTLLQPLGAEGPRGGTQQGINGRLT